MSATIQSPRHHALRAWLKACRKKTGQTQAAVASRLGRYQSYVSDVESGQRRVDVVEFLAFAEVLGFDPRKAIARLIKVARK
jgi:transcriptional regulator with XRE-family HTH domain